MTYYYHLCYNNYNNLIENLNNYNFQENLNNNIIKK